MRGEVRDGASVKLSALGVGLDIAICQIYSHAVAI